jgi:glutathione S-transferase
MLAFKGVEYREVNLIAGLHPAALRLKGFPGTTVPALDVGGERIQGSRAISRRLDELVPEPPLFGTDPATRRRVEEAERWGEQELQGVHRRAFRLGLSRRGDLRGGMVAPLGIRRPRLAAAVSWPVAMFLVLLAGATEERVRRELATLPALLDHVDELIAEGVIGGPEPNAADFQIGATIWALLAFEDFRPLVDSRPAARLARHIDARRGRVPSFVPDGWLPHT